MADRSLECAAVDAYLSGVSGERLRVLEELRRRLHRLIPDCSDALFYGKPAVRCGAGAVVAYGVTGPDCVLYLLSNTVVSANRERLAAWKTTTGTVRFQPAAPLPEDVLSTLVCLRLRELGVVSGEGFAEAT